MERETNTIITPAGKELVLKTYLTARERNATRDIILRQAKVKMGEGSEIATDIKIDGSILPEYQQKTLEVAVVKYGEQTNPDAILNNLLDSSPEEYDFVMAEAGKVNGNLTQAK